MNQIDFAHTLSKPSEASFALFVHSQRLYWCESGVEYVSKAFSGGGEKSKYKGNERKGKKSIKKRKQKRKERRKA